MSEPVEQFTYVGRVGPFVECLDEFGNRIRFEVENPEWFTMDAVPFRTMIELHRGSLT